MTVKFVTIRVQDLETAINFYENLTHVSANRFTFQELQLASIGNFLLFNGSDEACKDITQIKAILWFDNLDSAVKNTLSNGSKIVAEMSSTPNGRRAVVQHPDGSVFEYSGL